MADAIDAGNRKARQRQIPKAATRPGGGKVKTTIHLSVEADQRLSIHATMTGMDRSELVESLINQHLRRYVVSDRGGQEPMASGEAAA